MTHHISLPADDIVAVVNRALLEDRGHKDITAELIPAHTTSKAQVISRQTAIICGIAWFNQVFQQLDERIYIAWNVEEGQTVLPNQLLCHLEGPARALLTGERTALNFLQLLSGTATQANRYVTAVNQFNTKYGTHVRILDTRKTIPGLRSAQKYAVRCGGGTNHRMGLYDAFLIKENHITAAGSITKAVQAAQQTAPEAWIEVEVENLEQLKEAMIAGVKRVLLDNFTPNLMRQAVALSQGKVELEASGGIDFNSLEEVAKTGVDFISIGEITKNLHAVDLSMRIIQ